MVFNRLWPWFVAGALSVHPAFGAEASRIVEAQFRAANPCPVTGQTQGRCTGYVIDRVIPLACGGADHPDNMRWITVAEAKEKAKWDRIGCRPGRRLVLPHEMKSATEAFALGEGDAPVQGKTLGARDIATVPPPAAGPSAAPVVEADEPEQQGPHE
jgi:hypothetical protein